MQILADKSAIMAAIATMGAGPAEAAKLLAHHLLDKQEALQSERLFRELYVGACIAGAAHIGIDAEEETQRFLAWVENHGDAIINVGVSIAVFVIREHEHKKKWGWLGTAAAIVTGAALGIFFA